VKIFISSTFEDLRTYRDRVADAIERLGQERIRMEVFGARPEGTVKASLDDVARADAFIGIYAHRYGYVPVGSDKSITEAEFEYALTCNIPLFCFVANEEYPWLPKHVETEPGRSKLRALKERIASSVVRDTFTTEDDLAFKVGAALGHFLIQHTVRMGLHAASKRQYAGSSRTQDQIARRAERLAPIIRGARVLIVNDVPDEMGHVTRILREIGLEVVVATTTDMGLALLEADRFDAVISDMTRGNETDAGTRLIDEIRARGLHCPTILTVGRYEPERGTPPYAFGITNRVDELLNFLLDILDRVRG
jgi:CheY-like chemotaxis protein